MINSLYKKGNDLHTFLISKTKNTSPPIYTKEEREAEETNGFGSEQSQNPTVGRPGGLPTQGCPLSVKPREWGRRPPGISPTPPLLNARVGAIDRSTDSAPPTLC